MARKLKIPKRIAGLKIPKAIRKGPAAKFLTSPAGQLLVAQVLLVAGGALASRKFDPDSRIGKLLHEPLEGVGKVTRAMASGDSSASDRLAYACSEALKAFRSALTQEDGGPSGETGKKKHGPAGTATPSTPH